MNKKTNLYFSFILIFFFLLIFSLVMPVRLIAQNEIERTQISLQGLQEMGFTANVEGSDYAVNQEALSPGSFREKAIHIFEETGIRFVSDREVESSADIPFLHMHINTLELENGLIPFSIELNLYQPVKLILNRDLQTSASTWNSGVVGIVSRDQVSLIRKAAENLLDEFTVDYEAANSRL